MSVVQYDLTKCNQWQIYLAVHCLEVICISVQDKEFTIKICLLHKNLITGENFAEYVVVNSTNYQSRAHNQLGDVLYHLKNLLAENPCLDSIDIVRAFASIIEKLKYYNYADHGERLDDFQSAISLLLGSITLR